METKTYFYTNFFSKFSWFTKYRSYLSIINSFIQSKKKGVVLNKKEAARAAYVEKVLGFVDHSRFKPLKIVINSGNGAAGPIFGRAK